MVEEVAYLTPTLGLQLFHVFTHEGRHATP